MTNLQIAAMWIAGGIGVLFLVTWIVCWGVALSRVAQNMHHKLAELEQRLTDLERR